MPHAKKKPHYAGKAKATGGTLSGPHIEVINGGPQNAKNMLPSHIYAKWAKGGLLAFGVKPERPSCDLTHRCEWVFSSGSYGVEGRHVCGHGWVILDYEWKRAVRYQGLPENWTRVTPLPLFIGKVAQKNGSGAGAEYVNGLAADKPCDAYGNPITGGQGSPYPPENGPKPTYKGWSQLAHSGTGVNPHVASAATTWAWDGAKGKAIQTHGAKTKFVIATADMDLVEFTVTNFGSEYGAQKWGPSAYEAAKADALAALDLPVTSEEDPYHLLNPATGKPAVGGTYGWIKHPKTGIVYLVPKAPGSPWITGGATLTVKATKAEAMATDCELEKILQEEEAIEAQSKGAVLCGIKDHIAGVLCGKPAVGQGAVSGTPYCEEHGKPMNLKPLGSTPLSAATEVCGVPSCDNIAVTHGIASGKPYCEAHNPNKEWASYEELLEGLPVQKPVADVKAWAEKYLTYGEPGQGKVTSVYDPGDTYHTCPDWKQIKFVSGTTWAACKAHGSMISWSEFITGKKADAKMNKVLAQAAKTGLSSKASLLAKYQDEIPQPATPMSKQGAMLHAGDPCGVKGHYVVTEAGEGIVGNPAFVMYGVEDSDDPKEVCGYFKADEAPAAAVYAGTPPAHWIPLGVAPDGKQMWAPDYYLFGKGWIKTNPQSVPPPKPKHPQLEDTGATCYVLTKDNEVVPWYAGSGSLFGQYTAHSKHGKYLLYVHHESYAYQEEPF